MLVGNEDDEFLLLARNTSLGMNLGPSASSLYVILTKRAVHQRLLAAAQLQQAKNATMSGGLE